MAAELLLDTGAFVALVDRSESHHVDCVTVTLDRRGFSVYRLSGKRPFHMFP